MQTRRYETIRGGVLAAVISLLASTCALGADTSSGRIIQIPDNGALADYMTANEMWQVIVDNYNAMKDDPDSGNRYVMIGFHMESAKKFLPMIRPLLEHLRQYIEPGGALAYAELPIFQ